jgi:hypothetical protein
MPELPADAVNLALAWPEDTMSRVIDEFVKCARAFVRDLNGL